MSNKTKKEELMAILDEMPSYVRPSFAKFESEGEDEGGFPVPKQVVYVLDVGKKGWGFGEITIITDATGQTFIDGERTSRETIKEFLCALVDGAILDTDEDPEKHRAYVKATNTQCGEWCKTCSMPVSG